MCTYIEFDINMSRQGSRGYCLSTHHPDVAFRDCILEGIQQGLRVGYDYQSHKCYSATGSLKSAQENAEVVEAYIAKEVAAH